MRHQNQLSVDPYQLSSVLLVTSVRIILASHYQTLWQADWDGCVSNKRHTINQASSWLFICNKLKSSRLSCSAKASYWSYTTCPFVSSQPRGSFTV